MKLLCESCERLAAPGSWSVEGGVLRLVCAGCGRVHEQASPGPPRPPPPAPAPPLAPLGPGWLERGWADLRDHWGDPLAHERLIDQAVVRGALTELGKLYRDAIEASPGDAAALAAREVLIRKASAQLMSALPGEERGLDAGQARRARGWLVAAVVLALLAFVAWAFVHSGVLGTLAPP